MTTQGYYQVNATCIEAAGLSNACTDCRCVCEECVRKILLLPDNVMMLKSESDTCAASYQKHNPSPRHTNLNLGSLINCEKKKSSRLCNGFAHFLLWPPDGAVSPTVTRSLYIL